MITNTLMSRAQLKFRDFAKKRFPEPTRVSQQAAQTADSSSECNITTADI